MAVCIRGRSPLGVGVSLSQKDGAQLNGGQTCCAKHGCARPGCGSRAGRRPRASSGSPVAEVGPWAASRCRGAPLPGGCGAGVTGQRRGGNGCGCAGARVSIDRATPGPFALHGLHERHAHDAGTIRTRRLQPNHGSGIVNSWRRGGRAAPGERGGSLDASDLNAVFDILTGGGTGSRDAEGEAETAG